MNSTHLPRLLLPFLFLFFSIGLAAQDYTVTGTIIDDKTEERLIGVPVYIEGLPTHGAITDEKGRYRLSLPAGNYTLVAEYLGYEKLLQPLALGRNLTLHLRLKQTAYELQEVVITTRRPDANVADAQTGVEQLQIQQLNKLPVLLGERDVIKSLQLLPGVKSAGETSTGFFVRGGTADQNLIMLDNVSVYNASHLMGFFSTFNSDVLRDVTLYKGGTPAQYGERLSAILDVQQRNGDMNDYKLSGGIGLISSKINVEGPIQKGKSSFLLGARRTYADALARLSGIEEASNAYLYFYDLNAKLYFTLTARDQLSASGYLGRDKMEVNDLAEMDWGTILGSLRWTRKQNERLTLNTSLFYNQYSYYMEMDIGMKETGESRLKDWGLKEDAQYRINDNNLLRFGLQSAWHRLAPGDYDSTSDDEQRSLHLHPRHSWENALYASNQWKLSDRFEIIYGLRLSVYSAMGNGEYYEMNDAYEVTDSVWYDKGKFVKTYLNLEPRLSTVYKLNDASSLKASYARTTQNMHLITQSAQGTPFDRWASSSNNIKPQTADQFTLGYFRNFADNRYEFSLEGYYKDMRHQLDFKDNADIMGYDVIDTEVRPGKGRAYGIELMLKKTTGRFNGWVSYTLSKSEKKIDGINDGRWYNAFQDRTHDISIVAMYRLNRKWDLSATWVYYTGNAITYPSGKYEIDGKDIMYYAERNGYRAPAYHRLDLGATCMLKKTARFESELSFGLYNAYGRRNPYMVNFRTNDDDATRTSAYRIALFTYVPSISWNFKF